MNKKEQPGRGRQFYNVGNPLPRKCGAASRTALQPSSISVCSHMAYVMKETSPGRGRGLAMRPDKGKTISA